MRLGIMIVYSEIGNYYSIPGDVPIIFVVLPWLTCFTTFPMKKYEAFRIPGVPIS
jgi:hypothetical protein